MIRKFTKPLSSAALPPDAHWHNAMVDKFVAAYDVMHRWRKMPDEAQILIIGRDNFAFPIPLKKNGASQWYFDVAAGKDEIPPPLWWK
jgi:hypothetical protein